MTLDEFLENLDTVKKKPEEEREKFEEEREKFEEALKKKPEEEREKFKAAKGDKECPFCITYDEFKRRMEKIKEEK